MTYDEHVFLGHALEGVGIIVIDFIFPKKLGFIFLFLFHILFVTFHLSQQ